MSINRAILIGNLGKDPDVKYYEAGKATATFTMATTERAYTTAGGTQVPERTEWHNVVVMRSGLAEIVEKYLHKGDKVYVEGKIRTRSYADRNGTTRYVTEIYAEQIEMLSAKLPNAYGAAPTSGNATAPAGQSDASGTNTSS